MGIFRKTVRLVMILGVGSLLVGSWLAAQVQAQGGRSDDFTFLIPFRSENILAHFIAGNNSVSEETDLSLQTFISIPINRSNTIIYYDHWEDGYEADLTQPTQNSTQIWGDNKTANGVAPTVRAQNGGDSLLTDDVIVLDNQVFLPNNARDPSVIYYDGGDALTALGGSVAVTEVIWPLAGDTLFPGSLYTDAWELYPTSRWGQVYRLPIGEDLAGLREGFRIVGLNIQAGQNDTAVTVIDRNGAVKVRDTLDYGQELSIYTGINIGDEVQASAPVQVQLFSADPTRNYEERGGGLLPFEQWRNDYLAPRSADADFWLYNPHTTTLTVTVTMSTTTATVSIPPGQTTRYSNNGADLSTATGARFQADAAFYGQVALDDHEDRDWGYSLQPVDSLTPQVLVGWAPGNNRSPPTGEGNYSPVYVTALTNTTVTVHYADGNPDITVFVPALNEVPITSPSHDMTGALLFTTDNTPFLAVWGEEPTAPIAQPSIDAGSNIVALSSLALQKSFHLRDSLDCSGSINSGDKVRFTLQYFNNVAFGGNIDVTLRDDLPPEIVYVPGSTRLNGAPLPDGPADIPPFSSGAGGVIAPSTQGGSGVLTFDAIIASNASAVTNRASANAPILGSAEASLTLPLDQEVRPLLQINKTVLDPVDGLATWGQVITFGVTITNTSNQVEVSQLMLHDTFATADLTFLRANPPPEMVSQGTLTWTSLISDGSLLPDETIDLTVAFQVNPVPPTTTEIVNQASFNNVESDGNITRIFCVTETQLRIIAPTPTATSTPKPDSSPPETPLPPPTSPPQSTATPTPLPSATLPPTLSPSATPSLTVVPSAVITGTPLPVNLLPETGNRDDLGLPRWRGLGVLALGLFLWLIYRRRGD